MVRTSKTAVDGSAAVWVEPSGGASALSTRRDDRIDLLRGLALGSMLFDHIPGDSLSNFTIQGFGFCDAAEIFVFLAGYSAMTAYSHVFERQGSKAFIQKIGGRCLKLYSTQVVLFLATLVIIMLHASYDGSTTTPFAPILNDGAAGILRGLSLAALPPYLDILPLYIVLLALFPCMFFCIRRQPVSTIIFSTLIYLLANILHLNFPNYIDSVSMNSWTFNPLAWQLIYVIGAVFAWSGKDGNILFSKSKNRLRIFCLIYVLVALFCARWGAQSLGPAMLDDVSLPFFGNEPKCFEAPWRALNVVALGYLALTSSWFTTVARSKVLKSVVASGRHSLPVFTSICILSLLGRIIFRDMGNGPLVQFGVNAASVGFLFCFSLELDRVGRRVRPSVATSALRPFEQAG